ncbi:MFS transporter [Stenotrophomonas sp. SY1]|uniref:MFS transporter n=1 Tax=Stenotrophomonas sp. SY1 TaxID=477235 RepID=UPI001E548553|nr:MFS transporter [Stenotrophomonas sp. SY1]MCD9088594.1 MFS transporter [Stenotrophomonas sp. SY1]
MKRCYPWLICIVAMLMLAISNGMTMTGITAFDPSLLDEFGWSRGQLKFRDMFNLLLAAALSPFVGALIDRIGVRTLALFGSVLLAALYAAYSQVHSITHVYLIHVGFAAVVVSSGLSVAVIMVSQWFHTRRGTALGIALVGSSLGGMLVPKVIVALLPEHGWRGSFLLMAVIPLALFFVCLLLVKQPGALGMRPWGEGQASAACRPGVSSSLPDLSYRQALRTRTFWALSLVAVTTFWGIMSLSSHLILHMKDLGFSGKQAADGMFLLFGLGMVGKFLFGFLADVTTPKKVFVCNVVLMAVGAVIIALQQPALLWAGLIVMGLGWGGLYAILQLQIVEAFGLSAAGKILGTISLMDATSAGLGIWLTAVMFDHYGNYRVAFIVIAVLVVIGMLASLLVRDERRLAFAAAQSDPSPTLPFASQKGGG